MDTLELFKIAFPTDKSYQLSALAESHHIPLNNAHRADEDATTTAKLMIKAFEKFEQLHLDTQKQLYYLSKISSMIFIIFCLKWLEIIKPNHVTTNLNNLNKLFTVNKLI